MTASQKRFVFILFFAAAAFRLVYISEIRNKPCFYLEKWGQTDMSFFNLEARNLFKGNWWQNKLFFPPSIFTQKIAPKDKWLGWIGKRYRQAPLYPYFIALTYKLWGVKSLPIKLIQFLLGTLMIILIYLIALNLFSEQCACLSAVIALFFGPFYFYESLLLRASLLTFLYTLAVWIFIKIQKTNKIYPYFLFGSTLGLTFLLKEDIIIAFLAILVWQTWELRKKGLETLMKTLGGLIFGFMILLLPLIFRNLIVAGTINPFSALGGIDFILGNSADVKGEALTLSSYFLPIMEQTKGVLLPSMIKTIQTHPSILSFFKLLGHKIYLFWHWFEFYNNANYYYFQEQSVFLKRFTLSFFLIGPLSLLGIILSLAKIKKYIILYILIGGALISQTAIFALGRFRLPVIPFLIIFSAFALTEIFQAFKRKERNAALGLISIFLVLLLLINPPSSFFRSKFRTAEYWFEAYFYARQNKLEQSETAIKKALIQEPDNPQLWDFFRWIKEQPASM